MLDSLVALVWDNINPVLSLLRHWCSVWKIKSVAHCFPPSRNPRTVINMNDSEQLRVYWERRECGGKRTNKRYILNSSVLQPLWADSKQYSFVPCLKCPICLRLENTKKLCEHWKTDVDREEERVEHFVALLQCRFGYLHLDGCINLCYRDREQNIHRLSQGIKIILVWCVETWGKINTKAHADYFAKSYSQTDFKGKYTY